MVRFGSVRAFPASLPPDPCGILRLSGLLFGLVRIRDKIRDNDDDVNK